MGIFKKLFSGAEQKEYTLTNPYFTKMFSVLSDGSDLTAPYQQHPVVHAAIRAKARNLGQVPLLLYREGSDSPVHAGPVWQLFETVNPNLSKYQLKEGIITYLDNYGEAFLVKSRTLRGGVPTSLTFASPEIVTHKVDDGVLQAWEIAGDYYWPDEVIQFKYFNPFNMFRGLSPLKALELSLDADYYSRRYNKVFFENDGTPGTIFTTEQHLSDIEFERLSHELIKQRQGVKHSHKSMVLDGGMKAQRLVQSNKDMQFLELQKHTLEEVAMVFGVPKEALQVYEDINYATSVTADLSFWKKTMIPVMRLVEDRLNEGLLSEAGFRCEFDIASIDVLNQDMIEKAEAARTFFDMGVPLEELNRRLGLDFDLSNYEPPQAVAEMPKEVKQIPMYTPTEDQIKALRTQKWRELTGEVSIYQGKVNAVIRNYFREIEGKILRRATKDVNKTLGEEDITAIEDYFSEDRLKKRLSPIYGDVITAGVITVAEDLTIDQILYRRMLDARFEQLNGILKTARKEVVGKLQDALVEGLSLPEAERAKLIHERVKVAMDINMKQARTIARTESHAAFSHARHEAAKQAGFTHKRWITSRDAKVRDSHQALEGNKIRLEDKYNNGLGFPLDSSGPAGEVVNCRCVEVYENE